MKSSSIFRYHPRQVVLGDLPGANQSGDCCSFRRKTEFDRKMHIPGRCIIHIGSTYKTCPNLEKFDDVKIVPQAGHHYATWMQKLGRLFFEDYLEKGGEESFKIWYRTRWRL